MKWLRPWDWAGVFAVGILLFYGFCFGMALGIALGVTFE